jgi:hypothetical protein
MLLLLSVICFIPSGSYKPIVPKTTQGKVLPRINSRILVRTRSPPPRKIIGPLDKHISIVSCNLGALIDTYVKAIPAPVAPLHPIRQQDNGVVVITNPPRALAS